MPTDGKNCRKCFIENCSKCSGTKKNNICSICMEPYNPIYDKKKKIKSCKKFCEIGEKCSKCNEDKCINCNPGYILEKGECIINHSFKAVFQTEHLKENIILINKEFTKDIVELIIDSEKVKPSYNYTFAKKGMHSVIMLLNNECLET